MSSKIDDRVKRVMSSVFGVSIGDVNDAASPDTIESWDSLKHMNLIIALEEEFLVELSDQDIIEMINYKLIVSILGNLKNNK